MLSTAASSLPTNLTKLVHQQNWPSQAEPRSQHTQAAATTTTPPAGQQYRAASPPGWAAAETPPTLAGLHVPAQTTASLPITDGRHGVRDECQLHRPPRCSIFGRGGAPASLPHRSILCLPERNVSEVDPGEAFHAHAPASGHPDQPRRSACQPSPRHPTSFRIQWTRRSRPFKSGISCSNYSSVAHS